MSGTLYLVGSTGRLPSGPAHAAAGRSNRETCGQDLPPAGGFDLVVSMPGRR